MEKSSAKTNSTFFLSSICIDMRTLLNTIAIFSFLLLYSCENNIASKEKNENREESEVNDAKSIKKASWRNPFMTPMGVDISRIIRGYYLVGDFDKMLQFVIYPECYESEEIIHLLRKSNWGYEIKANNLIWQNDSAFILNIKTTKQQTIGEEQYFGKIVNDTAKLILFPEKMDLFPYFGDELSQSPCVLKENIDNVEFYYNKALFLPKSQTSLEKIFSFLNKNRDYEACFIGHTSDEGDAAYNLKLSIERAKAIYSYLVKKGISKDRLTYEGRGLSEPLYSNTTELNKAKNRRVEIKLTRVN
ncbi:MAG: OmpA family protein [Flavobacteriia bacterium]|jgi:outer membrane protein OmpA-like peptidoglycan-associated protein